MLQQRPSALEKHRATGCTTFAHMVKMLLGRSVTIALLLVGSSLAAFGITACSGQDSGKLQCGPMDLTCNAPGASDDGTDAGGMTSGNQTTSANNSGGNRFDAGTQSKGNDPPLPSGVDAGHPETGAAKDGGKAASGDVGAMCTANADCSAGLCLDFPGKGKHCTKLCASAKDCAAPSTGCFLVCLPP